MKLSRDDMSPAESMS